jgi:hypothetical protein
MPHFSLFLSLSAPLPHFCAAISLRLFVTAGAAVSYKFVQGALKTLISII